MWSFLPWFALALVAVFAWYVTVRAVDHRIRLWRINRRARKRLGYVKPKRYQ